MQAFKIAEINTGFCRVTYKTRNPKNENVFYCLQDDGRDGVTLYRCTSEGEPEYPITMRADMAQHFEQPKGDSNLEIKVREYLEDVALCN